MTDRLLTPSREIVSLDQARDEKENAKKRPPGSAMKDWVTREEMMMAVAKAAVALGQKMYDQASGELAENFEEQEHRMIQLITRTFARLEAEREAKTIRGRIRAFFRWTRGEDDTWKGPSIVQDAKVEPAPGSKEALVAELRRRIEACADGEDVTVPEGLTEEEAIEVANAYDAEVRNAVMLVRPEAES